MKLSRKRVELEIGSRHINKTTKFHINDKAQQWPQTDTRREVEVRMRSSDDMASCREDPIYR